MGHAGFALRIALWRIGELIKILLLEFSSGINVEPTLKMAVEIGLPLLQAVDLLLHIGSLDSWGLAHTFQKIDQIGFLGPGRNLTFHPALHMLTLS